MDDYHKHLSKPAKKLLLRLRKTYHASTGIDTAWLPSPDIEQEMGIDSDAVITLLNEFRKYEYVVFNDQLSNRKMVLKLRITIEGLAAAEQLRTSYRIKRLLKPPVLFVMGIVATLIAQLLYKAWLEG